MAGHGYTTRDGWFVDSIGRRVLLRGVNLSGDAKVPVTVDPISFVGRPAPLDEIDGHLRRIAGWGHNVVRLVITWEAVEHGGPGIYDEAYLDYLDEVVRR